MREPLFWEIMEFSRTAGCRGQAASLYRVLVGSSAQEIVSFARIQHRKMHQLHTPDLAAAHFIIRGSASADGLEAFTAWITAQGKPAFDQVRKSPSYLARILEKRDVHRIEWDAYTVVAAKAYLDKAKKEDFWSRLAAPAPPELDVDWPKDSKGFQSRHPELFKRFWNPKYAASHPFRSPRRSLRHKEQSGVARSAPGFSSSDGRKGRIPRTGCRNPDVAELKKRLLGNMVLFMRFGSAQSQNDPSYDPDWNSGYAQKHIDRCEAILDDLIDSLKKAFQPGARDYILKSVKKAVLALNKLNRKCGGGLIETDQREEICALIHLAAKQAGLRSSPGDITEEWREW